MAGLSSRMLVAGALALDLCQPKEPSISENPLQLPSIFGLGSRHKVP